MILPLSAQAARTKPIRIELPQIKLFAANTREFFSLRPASNGSFGAKQLRGWNRFLRCHYTGKVHAMAHRLANLIYAVARHFEAKQVTVISGYRAPKIAREKGNPKSPHKNGFACDFHIDGVENTAIRDYLRSTYKQIGVGYYPEAGFVHIDVNRKTSAYWVDVSKPGEPANYVKAEVIAEAAKPDPPLVANPQ